MLTAIPGKQSIAAVLTALFTLAAGATIGAAGVALHLELRRELTSRQTEEAPRVKSICCVTSPAKYEIVMIGTIWYASWTIW